MIVGWWLACGGESDGSTPPEPVCDAPCGAAVAAATWEGPPILGWAGGELATGRVNGEPVVLVGAPVGGGYDPASAIALSVDALDRLGTWWDDDDNSGSSFGATIAIAPDGSSYAVGALFGSKTQDQGGTVHLFDRLPVGTERPGDAAVLVIHGTVGNQSGLGVRVAYLDLTGVGTELIVSAPDGYSGETSFVGEVLAFDPTLRGEATRDQAVRRLTGTAYELTGWDADGDGLDELVTSTLDGVLHFPGPWEADLAEADADIRWSEGSPADDLGDAIEVLDDVDGDGRSELALG
ncbi:MAG: hypothetical protein ABMB14_40885, partial [Myxococcota bacterium]